MDEEFELTEEEEKLNAGNEWLKKLKEGRAFDPDMPNPKPIPPALLNGKQSRAIGR